MKFNMFRIKKWMAYLICGYLPLIIFIVLLWQTFDLLMSFLVAMISIILGGVLSNRFLIRHPFLRMIEGAGLLVWTYDSTGVIQPFDVQVDPPLITGRYGPKKEVSSVFDRDMACTLMVPVTGQMVRAKEIDANGNIIGECNVLKMPKEEEKLDKLFNFDGRPVFIFNKIIDSFLSKEVLSIQEKEVMIKHAMLNLLKKTENLSAYLLNFSRYIVEHSKPPTGWLTPRSKLLLIIAIIVIVIIMIMVAVSMFAGGGIDVTGGGGIIPVP